jgi:hypothetical protein
MGGVVKAVSKIASAIPGLEAINPYFAIASAAFQGYSAIQQRKQGKKAASAAREQTVIAKGAEESKRRYSMAQAQRARIAEQRQARIRTGQITTATAGAGLGMGGTSGFQGSVGSITSQYGANVGNINVAQGFADEQSGYNQAGMDAAGRVSTAQAKGAQWSQLGTLASNLPTTMGDIFSIDKKAPTA